MAYWPLLALGVAACATPVDATATAEQQFMIAQAPSGLIRPDGMPEMEWAPVQHTALCADGYYSYSDSRAEACLGHGGVRERGPRWSTIK